MNARGSVCEWKVQDLNHKARKIIVLEARPRAGVLRRARVGEEKARDGLATASPLCPDDSQTVRPHRLQRCFQCNGIVRVEEKGKSPSHYVTLRYD